MDEIINMRMNMTKSEIVENTKNMLKHINILAERIRNLDPNDRLPYELLKTKHLINSIQSLKEEEQRIIEYKYFKGKTHKEIAKLLYISDKTVSRKLKKIILNIGRMTFGFEEEFFKHIK